MKKLMLHILVLAAVAAGGLTATACSDDDNTPRRDDADRSIVILYENDVHCAVEGYTHLAGLRDAIAATDTAWAVCVSVGDFLQGNTTGAISHGQYIADIMRQVGYAAVTLGNHEFDYGVPHMEELLDHIGAPVVCANFSHVDDGVLRYAPYIMRRFGSQRVAFVGALTPETMVSEGYSFRDDDGTLLYDLHPDEFYSLVQAAVDEARTAGADVVVLLSHVGGYTQSLGFNSHDLVAATRGIDIVLDGHSHQVVPADTVLNADLQPVVVTQTGTAFANVGKLVIRADGSMSTTLIPTDEIPYSNPRVSATTDSVLAIMNSATSRVLAHSDYDFVVFDANGGHLVRHTETNAGDLVADAYRSVMGADIALENGGGIRNGLAAGDITLGDVVGVLPFNNTMCLLEVSGERIVQVLQTCATLAPAENGSFPQCSGLRYTIRTASHTVADVQVLQADGSWADIETERMYRVAVTSYNHTGGGMAGLLHDCTALRLTSQPYYMALATYLEETLGGTVPPEYATPQGRITIVDNE